MDGTHRLVKIHSLLRRDGYLSKKEGIRKKLRTDTPPLRKSKVGIFPLFEVTVLLATSTYFQDHVHVLNVGKNFFSKFFYQIIWKNYVFADR